MLPTKTVTLLLPQAFMAAALMLAVPPGSHAGLPPGAYSLTLEQPRIIESFDEMGPFGTTAPASESGLLWSAVSSNGEHHSSLRPRVDLHQPNGIPLEHFPTNFAYNMGTAIGDDRALGIYSGATGDTRRLTTAITNNTGYPISAITLFYDLEIWMVRVSNRHGGFGFRYSFNGAQWHNPGSAFSASLHETIDPENTTSYYWLNEPSALRNIGGLLQLEQDGNPRPLQPGETLYLRWDGVRAPKPPEGGQRKQIGAAIDNLQVEVTFPPTAEIGELTEAEIFAAQQSAATRANVPPPASTAFRQFVESEFPLAQAVNVVLGIGSALGEALMVYGMDGEEPTAYHDAATRSLGIEFRVRPDREGIVYVIEESTDLSEWNERARLEADGSGEWDEDFSLYASTDEEGAHYLALVRDTVPAQQLSKAFYRIRIVEE